MTDSPLDRYASAFETLTPDSLPALTALFAPDGRFVDPFHDARGRDAIADVFARMFASVAEPRFAVSHRVVAGSVGYLKWRFTGVVRGRALDIVGLSEVTFDADGLATSHVDYWDAAANVYERVPVLGAVLRWLRGRIAGG